MTKKPVNACPYCGSKNLKPIGTQEGIKFDLVLANCTNTACKPYTITIGRIEKKGA